MLVKLTASGRRLLAEMDADLMEAMGWCSALTPAERRLESLLRRARRL